MLTALEEGLVVVGVRCEKRLAFDLHSARLPSFVLLHDNVWDPADLRVHGMRYLWMLLQTVMLDTELGGA